MSELDKLVDNIAFDLENPRVTRDTWVVDGVKGVRERHESPRDILRRALEPIIAERDELKAQLRCVFYHRISPIAETVMGSIDDLDPERAKHIHDLLNS